MGELEERISALLGDPEQLGKLTRMAQGLLGGGEAAPSPASAPADNAGSLFGGDEAELMAGFAKVLRGMNKKSEHTALLEAMKPYLTEPRRNKMDKAMRIARLARAAELAFGQKGGI